MNGVHLGLELRGATGSAQIDFLLLEGSGCPASSKRGGDDPDRRIAAVGTSDLSSVLPSDRPRDLGISGLRHIRAASAEH